MHQCLKFILFWNNYNMFRTVFPSISICLLLYVQSWTPGDGRKDRPKHVQLLQNKINLRRCIWLVLL